MEHPYKTPEADLAEEKLTAGGFLSGGQPLWKAFWLFFAAGFLLLSVAARQAMVAIVDPLMQEAPGEHAVALTLWGMVGVELVRLAYLCLSLVVVWLRESEINQEGKARKLWDIEEGKGI